MTARQSEERLGTESIPRLFLSMGLPMVAAQVVNLLYSIVDRIYLGHIEGIGSDALTGVGLTNPIILIIAAFAALISTGAVPLCAIALGARQEKRANAILANSFFYLCVMSAVLMLLVYTVKENALYLIGASRRTFPYANDYLNIYLIGTPFVLLTNGLNGFLTGQGRSRTAMASVLIGALLNIALDPLFIFGFKMGIVGAAAATVISQMFSMLWVLMHLCGPRLTVHLTMRRFRMDLRLFKEILLLGLSGFVMQATESMISFVLNRELSLFGGDLYVGAMTVMNSILLLASMAAQGFQTGVQPVISYNYGAGNTQRVKKVFRAMLGTIVVLMIVFTGTEMLLPTFFARLFTEEEELITLVGRMLPVYVGGFLVFGLQMTAQPTYVGTGHGKEALFFALLRKVFLLIPLAVVLPRLFGGSADSIFWAEPIADVLSAICCFGWLMLHFDHYLDAEKGGSSRKKNEAMASD